MLFSRNKPTLHKLSRLLNGSDAQEENAPAPHPGRTTVKAVQLPAAAASGLPLIKDVKDIPNGRYWSFERAGVPSLFSESFAVLLDGDSSAVIFVAVEVAASHSQFELQRRVKEAGFGTVGVRHVTREIIKTIHESNRERKEVVSTDTELIARQMIDEALEAKASDIHIETRDSFAQLFFRIHGERFEQPSMAFQTAMEVCRVLYSVHADEDNKEMQWDPKTVMDTSIDYDKSKTGKRVQLRFSSAPITPAGNFHAVIRLLVMDEETIFPIEEVGFTPAQVNAIEEMLVGSKGMVLLVGPTNSGKSTSMQSFIERIYERRGPNIKVITIENPVEYIISRACQIGVPQKRRLLENRVTGSIYTTFLNGTLRQDPDVVMIGEIRDKEVAEIVRDLTLAGRKLLSTLHVFEVFAVFARLREIGVPPSVLYMHGFLRGVVYQRLVPVVCPHCSMPVTEALEKGRIRQPIFDRVMRVAELDKHDVRVRGDGCKHCRHLGIIGRTPCVELLVPDEHFLELLALGRDHEARQYWLTNSALNVDGLGITAVAHAIQKMRRGLLDPTNIENEIGFLVADSGVGPQGGTAPALNYPPSLSF